MLNQIPNLNTGISPQMYQYMNMLQMTNLQLAAYLQALFEENPVLEYEAPAFSGEAEPCFPGEHEENTPFLANSALLEAIAPDRPNDLRTYLHFQINQLDVPDVVRSTLIFLLADLDENGYLSTDVEALVTNALHISGTEFSAALETFQSLDPPGIGARSLRECLLIQARHIYPDNGLIERIIGEHLEDLSAAHYKKAAAQLHVSEQEVRNALHMIRQLDPHPGAVFTAPQYTPYVRADIIVEKEEHGFTVRSNHETAPKLTLSAEYLEMSETVTDVELKQYLSDKISQGKQLIHCMELRQSTLLSCVLEVIAHQTDFFSGKTQAPAPLSMTDLAKKLDLSVSTISRIVNGKYLRCDRGVYPLSYFFPAAVSAEEQAENSVLTVKHLIAKLVREEDKSSPLSDAQLQTLLEEQGIALSRRMIANYRKDLNIPSSIARKQ